MEPATVGALGQLGAAAIGGISSAYSAQGQNKRAVQMMEAQQKFEQTAAMNKYSWGAQDMKNAGLNPMLALAPGGGANQPHSQAAPQVGPLGDAPKHIASGAQAAIMAAQIENMAADTRKKEAEAKEASNRADLHPVTADKLRQDIGESAMRIERIIEETSLLVQQRQTSAAQAENFQAQTQKLKAELPHIQAQIAQLKAQTTQTGVLTAEAKQRLEAALPQLERIYKQLSVTAAQMSLGSAEQQQRAAESFLGQLGAYIRELTGLGRIMPDIRSTTINK